MITLQEPYFDAVHLPLYLVPSLHPPLSLFVASSNNHFAIDPTCSCLLNVLHALASIVSDYDVETKEVRSLIRTAIAPSRT